jgi:hypothetical protein
MLVCDSPSACVCTGVVPLLGRVRYLSLTHLLYCIVVVALLGWVGYWFMTHLLNVYCSVLG